MSSKDSADGQDASARRRPGELKAQVVTVLAEAEQPLTAHEVHERLDPERSLSYSTVVTILTRLHEAGSVTRHRQGRAFRYGAVVDAPGLVADRMSRLLTGEPDRISVLRRFVKTLAPDDERALRALLDSDQDR